MRTLLALLAFALAVIYLVLGVPALVRRADDLVRGSAASLARGGLPPGEYFRVDDGVLVPGPKLSAHRIGDVVYLPLLAPEAARAATAAGSFDADAALAVGQADRLFVVALKTADLRAAFATSAGQALPTGLARLDVAGKACHVSAWPEAARQFLLRDLAIPADKLFCLVHGDQPLGRVSGGIMLALALLLTWLGRRLWRGRAQRAPAAAAPGGGFWSRVAVGVAGLLAAVGVFAARFGDDLARHAGDAASARAARRLDDLPIPVASAKAALSDEQVFERLLEGVDLALEIQQACDFHAFLVDALGVERSLLWTTVLVELDEQYRRDAEGRYVMTAMRVKRRSSLARDGVPGEVSESLQTLPPSLAGGHVWLKLLPPQGDQPAQIDIDAVWRPGEGYTARVELELVAGDWHGLARGEPTTLRFSPRGMAQLAEVTRREHAAGALRLAAATLGAGSAPASPGDVDVAVLRVPGAQIEVHGDALRWRSVGSGAVQVGIRLRH